MKKIYFDEDTYIWKTKLNLKHLKVELLKECDKVISLDKKTIENDVFSYFVKFVDKINFPIPRPGLSSKTKKIEKINNMDIVVQFGLNSCDEIYKSQNKNWNIINSQVWINVIRAQNPVQSEFQQYHLKNIVYHTHTGLNEEINAFIPNYTYVYYIQMPDVMNEEDGVLYFKGKNGKDYWIRPEEDDLIIMPGNMPHSPNHAPNSTLDRIVLAGNVGFEMVKTEKTLF
jgi:cupin superfamily acireductone dioxygenase involved in methionine salvage